VKASFRLADALKDGPFDPDGFRDRLAAERSRLAQLSEEQLDLGIRDPERRVRYGGARWRLTVVELAHCSVWPHMGGRQWASGPVPRVAADLPTRGLPEDRLHSKARVARLAFADLPLIMFRRKRSAEQFRLDDGCHRAVAYYVAGFRQAFAYVGEYQGPGELAWPWEG
jgi:hypothetical protein